MLASALGSLTRGLTPTEDVDSGTSWKRSPGHVAEHLSMGAWGFVRHLEFINRKIVETVAKGGRLILEVPVRHGKSEICDIWTPIWFLENWQDKQVALASYEQTWAVNKFGRRVRNTIEQNKRELTMRLSKDLTGAGEWQTTRGGGMFTTGVGGPLTGRGVHLMLIDDPIKNRAEANSKIIRDNIWEWWEDAADTRIEPGGAAIILMARWHQDDIVGRIKSGNYISDDDPEAFVDDWEIINLPALAKENDVLGREPGEPLWPERWSKPLLLKQKRGSARRWASLYQQDPRKEEGNMFNRAWFDLVEDYPREKRMRWVRAWDKAGTEEKGKTSDADYTVGLLIGELDGEYWITDMVRFRGTPGLVRKRIRQTAILDGRGIPIYDEQEPGQSGKDQVDEYAKKVLKGFTYRAYPSTGSKETRAEPVSSAAEAGNVHIVQGKHGLKPEDVKTFLDEVEDFPDADHDDIVDAASLGFTALAPGSIRAHNNRPKLVGSRRSYWRVA